MSGVIGQKWNTDRPEKRKKINSALKPELYEKVIKLSENKRWTISATIEYIVEQHFK